VAEAQPLKRESDTINSSFRVLALIDGENLNDHEAHCAPVGAASGGLSSDEMLLIAPGLRSPADTRDLDH
jgi:hypothetical protein